MGENHLHHVPHGHSRRLMWALLLNIGFTILEVIGGFWANSLAILSDAIHDFGDIVALGLAWYFQVFANKKRDDRYSYGYHRYSVLGAIISAVILLTGSVIMVVRAVPRFWEPAEPHGQAMMVLAVVGVLVNGGAFLILHGGKSLNEKVIGWHLLEDVLGWVAVLVGGALIWWQGWNWIDPALSLAIAVYIVIGVARNLRRALQITMQGVPSEMNVEELKTKVAALSEIQEIHDVHIWTLDGEFNIMTFHAVLCQPMATNPLMGLKFRIKELLAAEGVHHVTVEFELPDEHCHPDHQGEEAHHH